MADYGSLGLTLGRHPLALLRDRLARMRLKSAKQISEMPHGSRVRAAGIVTCRQRPGTASGLRLLGVYRPPQIAVQSNTSTATSIERLGLSS